MATLYVSPFGSTTNPGTFEEPLGSIQQAVDELAAGDVLILRAGNYAEDVKIANKEGTADAPILIRPYGRELVNIDGSHPKDIHGQPANFRIGNNDQWVAATDPDAHPDEYVSTRSFPVVGDQDLVKHGAFVDREPYTRLITYARIEDLRAVNETFGRLPLDHHLPPLPGLPVVDDDDHPVTVTPINGTQAQQFKFPWVYMGPGLYFDEESGKIHIRLSHTANRIPGLADYDGGTDPRHVRLAISRFLPGPFAVENCNFLRVEHITMRFGGSQTVRINESNDIEFNHVRVQAGSDGIRMGTNNHRVVLRHCEFTGGIPPWMFRSDIKEEYRFLKNGQVLENRLGAGTSKALMFGVATDVDTMIHHCEFVDGHDLSLFGQGTTFRHNWVHNMHDDALILDAGDVTDLNVFRNVIMTALEVMSFAGKQPGGTRRIHRNLIDLRSPIAGIRPRPADHLLTGDDNNRDGSVFRFGQLYKSNPPDGPLDFFQNTCLVREQVGRAGIQHFNNSKGGVRRSFNNIFVDVTPSQSRPDGYATAFLPSPTFRGPTDGNCYYQRGSTGIPLLRNNGYDIDGQGHLSDTFASLAAYYTGTGARPTPSSHFENSKVLYPPGFESNSIDIDPLLRRFAADGAPQFDDDLRPREDSPARQHGLDLASPTIGIDDPLAPAGLPDMGYAQVAEPPLQVGVDGRRMFPEPD